MAVITLIAATPGADVPGVYHELIDFAPLNLAPVRRWIADHSGSSVYVAGQGGRIPTTYPTTYPTMDVLVSDEEYREYLDAVASAR